MTPLVRTRSLLLSYLAAWIPLGALLAAMLRLTPEARWADALVVAIPAAAIYSPVLLAVRYPVRGLPAGRMRVSRLFSVHLIGAVFAAGLWLGILRLWVELLGRSPAFDTLPELFRRQVPSLAGVGLLLYLLAVTFHSLLNAVERSKEAQQRALEVSLIAREAEITLLRSQVDPHFLFNALNTVAGLTHGDPDLARSLCLRLGGFLRASLEIGRRERIPFGEELALARDYLAIEQIRFGDRLRVKEAIDEGSLDCPVPPLILLPLLENAVRHGISSLVGGGEVKLVALRRPAALEIVVENPRDPAAAAKRGQGMGLENVRRRLYALYGRVGGVTVREDTDRFRVELEMPVHIPSSDVGGQVNSHVTGDVEHATGGATAIEAAGEAAGGPLDGIKKNG